MFSATERKVSLGTHWVPKEYISDLTWTVSPTLIHEFACFSSSLRHTRAKSRKSVDRHRANGFKGHYRSTICLKVRSKDIVSKLVLVNMSINIVNTYFSDTFGLRHKIRMHCVIRRSPRETSLKFKRLFYSCLLKKDVFRKNSHSPWGIEPQIFGFRAPMLYHWATETPRWARSITKFIWHASCILLGSGMSIAYCL